MKRLTNKEEEVMAMFWERGEMFVNELLALYPDPKPHFNTVSTIVRSLEADGFLDHKAYGKTYQYFPIVTQEEYGKNRINGAVDKYFGRSYLDVVSSFIKEEKLSAEELRDLISQIEGHNN